MSSTRAGIFMVVEGMLNLLMFCFGMVGLTVHVAFAAPQLTSPLTPPLTPPLVMVTPAKKTNIFDTLVYPARIVPKVQATLLSETDGVVEKMLVPLGGKVQRGEAIFILRNSDPVYEYAPFRMKSPISGLVSQIEVTQGSYVTKGTKLATITDPSKIKIMMEVVPSDIPVLRNGMEGILETPNTDPINVIITGVSPMVDPGTGTATVELIPRKTLAKTPAKNPVKNPANNPPTSSSQNPVASALSPGLSPGLIGKITFRVREHFGIEVNEIAITYKGKAPFLRILENGVANMRPVTLGKGRQGQVEILGGISEGQKVILRANKYVADGEKVEVQNESQASPENTNAAGSDKAG